MASPWLTLVEAADRLKVHPATLRRAVRSGRLRHARVSGKLLRFQAAWLDQWVQQVAEPQEEPRS